MFRDEASQRLSGVILASPITGIVADILVRAGDPVERGDTAMIVVDPNVVVVRGTIAETEVLSIRMGAPAVVRLHALSGAALTRNDILRFFRGRHEGRNGYL